MKLNIHINSGITTTVIGVQCNHTQQFGSPCKHFFKFFLKNTIASDEVKGSTVYNCKCIVLPVNINTI